MIKLTFCLRRLPDLSLAQFQEYWFEQHGPLVRSHREALRIKRYVQLHSREDVLNEAFRESRNAPEGYDGVAQLWWDSLDDLRAATETEAGQKAALALLEDEQKFIDLANSPLWIGEERVVIGD